MTEVDPSRLLAEFHALGRIWYQAYRHRDGYVLRFPTLSDFVVSPDLRTVETRPHTDLDEEALALLLIGGTMAFVLSLRGHCVLHAGAVAIDRRAVAFAGMGGTGKSTCTALLCSQGAALLADDVLRVEFGDTLMAIRGSSSVRLRPKAEKLLELFSDRPASRRTYDDRLAIYPSRAAPTVPLTAVILPRPNRQIEQVHLERVTGATALTNLLVSARIMGWSEQDRQRRQFEQLARLARSAAIYRADIPWRDPASEDVAVELFAALKRVIE